MADYLSMAHTARSAQEFELAQLTRAAVNKSTQLGRSEVALSTRPIAVINVENFNIC